MCDVMSILFFNFILAILAGGLKRCSAIPPMPNLRPPCPAEMRSGGLFLIFNVPPTKEKGRSCAAYTQKRPKYFYFPDCKYIYILTLLCNKYLHFATRCSQRPHTVGPPDTSLVRFTYGYIALLIHMC